HQHSIAKQSSPPPATPFGTRRPGLVPARSKSGLMIELYPGGTLDGSSASTAQGVSRRCRAAASGSVYPPDGLAHRNAVLGQKSRVWTVNRPLREARGSPHRSTGSR